MQLNVEFPTTERKDSKCTKTVFWSTQTLNILSSLLQSGTFTNRQMHPTGPVSRKQNMSDDYTPHSEKLQKYEYQRAP